jgi:hypothetical protein
MVKLKPKGIRGADRRFYERKVALRGVVGDGPGWLGIMVGCEQVRAERREMLTAHRIFVIAKSRHRARSFAPAPHKG